ncbi:thiamine biosynthesis protein ThiJ [Elysia marginata]|uniref:Thiamine biosynthesis protein ThiJ n=1 Tax=Elysia marginata TaxID=1093978 RepID=A0AAV4J1A4_9GAST|nr:thiamine biosynthesis protein ThiJ [Elysia marginata]
MAKKILIILTSTDKMGDTGKPTGWYLPELAHPYKVLVEAGFEMDSISPKGGKSPVDPGSVEAYKDDPVCQWFHKDDKAQALVNSTKTAGQINPSDYVAVLYPGGHGPMFDLANDATIAEITSKVFNNGGVVAAVCHGPAGLVPVKINGEPIVKGRKVTAFSNAEEDAMQLSSAMPFMLETKLKEQGGQFAAAALWQNHVVVDGKLITGQNPNSAHAIAEAMIALLN